MKLKARVWELVETAEGDDLPSRLIDVFILALIVLSVVLLILDSVPGMLAPYAPAIRAFELFVIVVFTVEYLLRLWSCTADPNYNSPVRGRIRFALTPLALVDLAAIGPFYVPWLFPSGLLVLRVLRLVRLLRLYKVGRYAEAPRLVIRAFNRRRAELLAAVFVLFLLLISMGSLLYLAENPDRPDVYSSIPVSMWWSLLALTGNGQTPPITLAGRLIAAAIAVIGVGLFALPAGLLAAAFSEEMGSEDARAGERDVEIATERMALANAAKRAGTMEADRLAEDYSDTALLLTPSGAYHGPQCGPAIAEWMDGLARTHGGAWTRGHYRIAGDSALIHWKLDAADGRIDAIETLTVREGLIRRHTVALGTWES